MNTKCITEQTMNLTFFFKKMGCLGKGSQCLADAKICQFVVLCWGSQTRICELIRRRLSTGKFPSARHARQRKMKHFIEMALQPYNTILIDNTKWYPNHQSPLPSPPPCLQQCIKADGHGSWFRILYQATYFLAMSFLQYLPILLCEFSICCQHKNCIMCRVTYQLQKVAMLCKE